MKFNLLLLLILLITTTILAQNFDGSNWDELTEEEKRGILNNLGIAKQVKSVEVTNGKINNNKVEFDSRRGGSINIDYRRGEDVEISNLNKGSEITFKEGEIVEAKIIPSKDTEYEIGGVKFEAESRRELTIKIGDVIKIDSEEVKLVILKDNRFEINGVQLELKGDVEIEIDETINIKSDDETEIKIGEDTYKIKKGNILLSDGKIIGGKFNSQGILKIRNFISSFDKEVGIEIGDKIILKIDKETIVKIGDRTLTIKKGTLILDDDGNVLEGSKFTTVKDSYNLRGFLVDLKDNNEVEFLEDRVVVKVDSGYVANPVSNSASKGVLEIQTKEPGFLNIPQGKFQGLDRNSGKMKTSLFYEYDQENRVYYKHPVAIVLNEREEIEFAVFSAGNQEVDIIDKVKNNMNRPALFLNENSIGSFSSTGLGPIINLLSGNRVKAGLNKNGGNDLQPGGKSIVIAGLGGWAYMQKSGDDIPTLGLTASSLYLPNGFTFYGKNGQIYVANQPIIRGLAHGKSTSALRTRFFDASNKPLNSEMLINDQGQYAIITPDLLKGPYNIYRSGNTVVSSKVFVNHLTPEARDTLALISEKEQAGLPINNLPALEIALKKIALTRSPITATVTLPRCSGTLVGYSNDGSKAYILTADHCVGRRGSYTRIWLNSMRSKTGGKWKRGYSEKRFDGKSIRAKVVATSRSTDVTLLEIQNSDRVRRRGYVQIPKDHLFAKRGDKVIRIGCPYAASSYRMTSCTVRSIYPTRNRWDTINVRGPGAIGGESGGSIIKYDKNVGPRIVGTLSTGHGFGGVAQIHRLIGKDYGFLITGFWFVFDFVE